MSSTTEKWGFFPTFDTQGSTGDPVAIDACVRGALVKSTMNTDGTMQIQYKGHVANVTSSGFHEHPAPEFSWDEPVFVTEKNMWGRIEDICWHFKQQRYYYYLVDERGRNISKRYFSYELSSGEQS